MAVLATLLRSTPRVAILQNTHNSSVHAPEPQARGALLRQRPETILRNDSQTQKPPNQFEYHPFPLPQRITSFIHPLFVHAKLTGT